MSDIGKVSKEGIFPICCTVRTMRYCMKCLGNYLKKKKNKEKWKKNERKKRRTLVFPLTCLLTVGVTTTGYCGGQNFKLVQKNIRWVNGSLMQRHLLETAFWVQTEDILKPLLITSWKVVQGGVHIICTFLYLFKASATLDSSGVGWQVDPLSL